MQRVLQLVLFVILITGAAQPAQAQGPTIFLPVILASCDNDMPAILEISDGTTTVNLIAPAEGIHLAGWRPAIARYKGGGTFTSSPLAGGRRLTNKQFDNAIETFELKANDLSQDEVARRLSGLLQLLEKATDYWTTTWQDEPVWLKVKAKCETNARYAIIKGYQLPELSNTHGQPFLQPAGAVLDDLSLIVERDHWLGLPPGQGECAQASSEYEWNYSPAWEDTADIFASFMVQVLSGPNTGRIVAVGGLGTEHSDDDGDTWNATAGGVGYAIIRTSTGRILIGGNGDISASDDDGATWAVVTTAPVATVGSFVQSTTGRIFAGETDQIWYSDDDGATWAVSVSGLYLSVRAMLQSTTGRIFAASDFNLRYSDDDGLTWSLVPTTGANFTALAQTNTGRILAGGSDIFASDDDGLTWFSIAPAATNDFLAVMSTGRIVAAPVDGSSQATIAYSDDNGISWTTWTTATSVSLLDFLESTTGRLLSGDNGGELWIYGPITPADMGSLPTCDDKSYVANKQSVANLTHIFRDDGGVFSANLFPIAGATALLPAAPAVNDAVYFGSIPTALAGGATFSSLVFNLETPVFYANSYTITWEVWTGAAWVTLTVQDGTNQSGVAGRGFSALGVNSVHWVPPSGWATTAVNGVTAYWVRARVSALVGAMSAPTQAAENVYAVVLPYADIAAAQVKGDIPALAQILAHNRSDKDGPGGSAPNLYDNRLLVGLRSYDRGATFQAYLNVSDEQNPAGVTVSLGTNTTFAADPAAPTGRRATYNPAGAEAMATRATFTLGPGIARDYYGTFHAFLRVKRTAGVSTDFNVRLQVATGSGGVMLTTASQQIQSTMAFDLLDFGRVTIPASGLLKPTELGDSTVINIQASAASGVPDLYLYDLILMPVDEWIADPEDKALETDSEVGQSGGYAKLLDIDSITAPKRNIRTMVRRVGSDLITAIYQAKANGEAILQANAHQRLWFLAAQALLEGTHTGADNAATLTDSAANFVSAGVVAGMVIYNTTDGSSATITAVTATTIAGTLAGGTGNDWDAADAYYIICPHWAAPPEICHSVQAFKNSRYLGMRGAG